jgi:hypothetical protein
VITDLEQFAQHRYPDAWLTAFDAEDRSANADKLTEAELDHAIVRERDATDSALCPDPAWDRDSQSLIDSTMWRDLRNAVVIVGGLVAAFLVFVVQPW